MQERDHRLRNIDAAYVTRFIDPNMLGNLLGEGLRSRVYSLNEFKPDSIKARIYNLEGETEYNPTYAPQMVIKIPRTESIILPSPTNVKLEKLKIGNTYFKPYIVVPTYMLDSDSKYTILQRRLTEYEYLTPDNMNEVRDQVEDVFVRHRELAKNGMRLDLMGIGGRASCIRALYSQNTTPRLENILIERTENGPRVAIHDISVSGTGPELLTRNLALSQAARIARKAGNEIEPFLIKRHFGLDIK